MEYGRERLLDLFSVEGGLEPGAAAGPSWSRKVRLQDIWVVKRNKRGKGQVSTADIWEVKRNKRGKGQVSTAYCHSEAA